MIAAAILLVLAGVVALVLLAGTCPFGWPGLALVGLLALAAIVSGDRR